MTYRERFDAVVASGKYIGMMEKLKALAQLNFNNAPKDGRICAVCNALEDYEAMTGIVYYDPTTDEFEELAGSIIGIVK